MVDHNDEFIPFRPIPRLRRDIVITEKLDGTSGQIAISDDGLVRAGSRERWLTPEEDNYGFAAWVKEHEQELAAGLGPGRHYGEWWGEGICRGYGLSERRFSLFNEKRWGDMAQPTSPHSFAQYRPACCHVVPLLYRGPFTHEALDDMLELLRQTGSVAAPGFMRPEGVIIFHTVSNSLFKVTLEHDDKPKREASR
jgi:hypothetical protein